MPKIELNEQQAAGLRGVSTAHALARHNAENRKREYQTAMAELESRAADIDVYLKPIVADAGGEYDGSTWTAADQSCAVIEGTKDEPTTSVVES